MKNKILCLFMILAAVLILPINVTAFDYNENDVIIDFLPGDIDSDEKITAVDARLCLRASANLDELTEKQIKSADFDGNGVLNSTEARKILRASAGLDILTVTINIEQGQNLVIGPLKIWGVKCTEKDRNEKLSVSKTTETENPELAGEPVTSFFTVNAAESGCYNLSITSYQPWNDTEITHYNIVLNVK